MPGILAFRARACQPPGAESDTACPRAGGSFLPVLTLARAADALFAACAIEIPAGEPPEWVQLMPAGELHARDGRRWRLEDAAAVLAATQRLAGATDLVFDYEHQTDYSKENGQPAPAAGWIRELQARAGDIWARVEWTERAREMLRKREYRYVSPTFSHTRAGKVIAIHRAALTNAPALDLPALAKRHANHDDDPNAGGFMHEQLKRILAKLGLKPDSEPTTAEADTAMARIDPPAPIDMAALATALGLAATAKAADILAAATARGGELAAALGLATTATADEVLAAAKAAKASTATTDPTAFVPRAEFDRVATRLNTLETTRVDEQATASVDDAIKAGKLAPAQRDWGLASAKKDLAAFTTYLAGAPVIVTPAATATATPGDPKAALTADELAVCRTLGIAEDKFRESRAKDLALAATNGVGA